MFVCRHGNGRVVRLGDGDEPAIRLGMSDEEDVWTPERVMGKKMENRRTLAVSVGGQHTALLVSNSD